MYWYQLALKKYAEFNGRAHRTAYWMFVLINLLITIAINVVESALGFTGYLGLLYALAVFLPGLGAAIRRLHDTGRSGWWMLIGFIPLIGAIVLIVFLAQPSQAEANIYGEPDTSVAPA
jgi:uncharacterized membrane protein YhaH (DUF805 family)